MKGDRVFVPGKFVQCTPLLVVLSALVYPHSTGPHDQVT
jgi:hypothetical protein